MTREKWRGQKGPLYNRCVLKLFNKQTKKQKRKRNNSVQKGFLSSILFNLYSYYSKFK